MAKTEATKATIVGVYVVALTVTFLAGRGFESQTTPFTHAEVENIAAQCTDGEFVGGCTWCKQCKSYEFSNGGCSGFRDTFCTFCESIPNCVRENIECTDRYDGICNKCECNDPIDQWGDIEVAFFRFKEMVVPEDKSIQSVTHACYFEDDCKPCSVCPDGQWEVTPCSQDTDTECQPCIQCDQDEWVQDVCTYHSNTVCIPCNHCDKGTFTSSLCTSPFNDIDNHYLVQGSNAVCTECSECAPFQWVSGVCEEFSDTQCTDCSACSEKEYISTECAPGMPLEDGSDTVCADCTPLEDGYWEFEACIKTGTSDTVYRPCYSCQTGEYEETSCGPTEDPRLVGTDTVCPNCEQVLGCPEDHVVCKQFGDSECKNCDQEEQWYPQTCCAEGYIGETCEYIRHEYGCGTNTFRERTAFRGGFFDDNNGVEGEDFAAFVLWCKNMCDDFPDCTAFEVENAAWDGEITSEAICAMKDTVTVLDGDSSLSCYSKMPANDLAVLTEAAALLAGDQNEEEAVLEE